MAKSGGGAGAGAGNGALTWVVSGGYPPRVGVPAAAAAALFAARGGGRGGRGKPCPGNLLPCYGLLQGRDPLRLFFLPSLWLLREQALNLKLCVGVGRGVRAS